MLGFALMNAHFVRIVRIIDLEIFAQIAGVISCRGPFERLNNCLNTPRQPIVLQRTMRNAPILLLKENNLMAELTDIINWRRISPLITTSGQPTEEQLRDIQKTGVTHIVNLGPHDNKGALDDEPGSVTALGMTYIYIPVDFEAPTDKDFEEFQDAMADLSGQKVHVHCIYNARVSAFFYRYAKSGFDYPENEAFENMEGIWRPGNDWANFIGDPSAIGRPNRYAGEDY